MSSQLKPIAIFGAGGFGREVKMLLDDINADNPTWHFLGYFDDGIDAGAMVDGYALLGGRDRLNQWSNEIHVVFAIGNPVIKSKVVQSIVNENIKYPKLIHPSVITGVSLDRVGEGAIICAGNILTVNIDIGQHVILNLACTTGHDAVIGSYSSIMPGVNISGETILGEGVYLGTGCTVINLTEIGEYAVVGAGAVVSKSIPPRCTAVGIPAKPIKFHE